MSVKNNVCHTLCWYILNSTWSIGVKIFLPHWVALASINIISFYFCLFVHKIICNISASPQTKVNVTCLLLFDCSLFVYLSTQQFSKYTSAVIRYNHHQHHQNQHYCAMYDTKRYRVEWWIMRLWRFMVHIIIIIPEIHTFFYILFLKRLLWFFFQSWMFYYCLLFI